MAKRAARHFFLFGKYSLALLLPKKWLTELGAKQGSIVNIEYDSTKQKITLHFGSSKATSADSKIAKPKTTTEGDWEPIPQL